MDGYNGIGVTFVIDGTTLHSYRDLRLLQLQEIEIPPPSAKRHLISGVLGLDSAIDLTNHFGPVRFENRQITLTFEAQDKSHTEWCSTRSTVENALHGRTGKVILDIDPDYYWSGFIAVTASKTDLYHSNIVVSIDAFPYKRKLLETIASLRVPGTTGTATVTVDGRMPVRPVATVSANCSVLLNGISYDIEKGSSEVDFSLVPGTNSLKITGVSTIDLSWEEGSL